MTGAYIAASMSNNEASERKLVLAGRKSGDLVSKRGPLIGYD